MTAQRIRPLLGDDLLVALRGSFLRGGGGEKYLAEMTGDYADLYGDKWRAVTAQADAIGQRAHDAIREKTQGRDLHLILDGHLVAEALAIATDEVMNPDFLGHHDALSELEGIQATGVGELDAEHGYHLGHVEKQLVRNGLLAGRKFSSARLKAVIIGRQERGHWSRRESAAETVEMLGAAALGVTFPQEKAVANDFEERVLGAAAFGAAHGFRHGWDIPEQKKAYAIEISDHGDAWDHDGSPKLVLNRRKVITVPKHVLRTIVPMTVRGAKTYLEERVMDPREQDDMRDMLETLLESLELAAQGKQMSHLSVGRLLGLREEQPATTDLRPSEAFYDAAPVGEYPPVFACEGKNGRSVSGRALVDKNGRLAGYRAYDTLSNEFHGDALQVVYDLAGRRSGHLHHGKYVDGLRDKHVMTAPDTLATLASIEEKKEVV